MNILKWTYWRYGAPLIPRLPGSALKAAAGAGARVSVALFRGKRFLLRSELSACGLLEGARADAVAHEAVRNQFLAQLKLAYLPRLNPGNIGRFIAVEGLERLDRALEKGSGVILLNPHFGPFLLIMPALGHRGYRLNQVALQGEPIVGARKGFAKRVYEAKYRAIEGNMPARFINAAENPLSIREVFRSLARNECVLFASTGRGGKAWHAERFLGRPATFNETPFRVAVKSGASLLPVFVLNADPLARVVIEEPLVAAGDGGPGALIKSYVGVLEGYVRRHPDHFAHYLLNMRLQAWWDDHPFFADYPGHNGPAETRKRGL